MDNKRGISDVVTTVLIVLLSLVAVAIIWSFISPLITKSGTQISQTQACLSANIETVTCTIDGANYNVTVRRSAGTADITHIKLIFSKADDTSTAFELTPAPNELETNLYNVAFTDATGVAVSAGITDAQGDVNYCTPSQPILC